VVGSEFSTSFVLGLLIVGGNKKYSSSSSLLLAKLISVESRGSAFLFLGFSTFAVFNCFLREVIASKRKNKAFSPE
jgi:hypothetical protein